MPTAYYISVTLHLLAALLWLGGTFFLAAVGAPVLRKVEPPELRAELFRKIGVQFRMVGWVSIIVLVITGFANLHYRGLLRGSVLGDPLFWRSRYGQALTWRPEALRYRRAAAWMARVGAVVGIVLVVAAVRLARGG